MTVLARRLCVGAQRSARGHEADSRVMWSRSLHTKTGTCLLSGRRRSRGGQWVPCESAEDIKQILKRDRVSNNQIDFLLNTSQVAEKHEGGMDGVEGGLA